jgi:hypothetical protein
VVTLVDSSSWIEFLRGTESDSHIKLRTYFDLTTEVAISEVIAMELLAGVRDPAEEAAVDQIIGGTPLLATVGLGDYTQAALLYRTCRAAGDTIRRMNDCLIAAVAIRNDVPVMHNDRDFDVLARHTALRIA